MQADAPADAREAAVPVGVGCFSGGRARGPATCTFAASRHRSCSPTSPRRSTHQEARAGHHGGARTGGAGAWLDGFLASPLGSKRPLPNVSLRTVVCRDMLASRKGPPEFDVL